MCITVAWPFTLKSILLQKKNYENSNISPCKYIIFKLSSKRIQNPSTCYYDYTSLNPMPYVQVIHKSLKILIEKIVGDLGNRKRNGGHVGVSAKTMPMKSTLGSMPAHREC
jgi:hypothetical protein